MNSRGRKASSRRSTGSGWKRSPVTAFVVAFALLVQLFAAATPPSLPAPAFAGADEATVAAELKAAFGNTAELCAHINGHGAPGKHLPCGNGCDQCPLCRGAAQAVAFVRPDLPALPKRLDSDAHAFRPPPGRGALPAYPAQPNPARAPPLAA